MGWHRLGAGVAAFPERDHADLRSPKNLWSNPEYSSSSFLKSILNDLKPAGLLVF
jgi:hypothetical protein